MRSARQSHRNDLHHNHMYKEMEECWDVRGAHCNTSEPSGRRSRDFGCLRSIRAARAFIPAPSHQPHHGFMCSYRTRAGGKLKPSLASSAALRGAETERLRRSQKAGCDRRWLRNKCYSHHFPSLCPLKCNNASMYLSVFTFTAHLQSICNHIPLIRCSVVYTYNESINLGGEKILASFSEQNVPKWKQTYQICSSA